MLCETRRNQRRLLAVAFLAAIGAHLVTDLFMTAEITGSWLFWLILGAVVSFVTSNDRERAAGPGVMASPGWRDCEPGSPRAMSIDALASNSDNGTRD